MKYIYAIIPAILLLVAVTVLMEILENRHILDSERVDDRVLYGPLNFLRVEYSDEGSVFHIIDPYMLERRFPVEKSAGQFRIVVTGESFAMGTPYASQAMKDRTMGDLPNWIGADFQYRFPSRSFEVINAAAGAQTSNRVANIVEEMTVVKPDLIIVAMGNNEFAAPATPLNDELHQWVLYRLMKRALLPEPTIEQRRYFVSQSPAGREIEKSFRSNIDRIVAVAKKARVPLALATMPINAKYLGTESDDLSVKAAAADPAMAEGKRLLAEKKYEEAMAEFSKCKEHALAARFIGECLEGLGRYEEAKDFYNTYAENHSTGRTRPSFNLIIREKCREHGLIMPDLQGALEKMYPHGIVQPDLFLDYCHMNWRGYHLMAQEIVRSVVASGKLPKFGRPRDEPTVEQLIAQNGWEYLYTVESPAKNGR